MSSSTASDFNLESHPSDDVRSSGALPLDDAPADFAQIIGPWREELRDFSLHFSAQLQQISQQLEWAAREARETRPTPAPESLSTTYPPRPPAGPPRTPSESPSPDASQDRLANLKRLLAEKLSQSPSDSPPAATPRP